MGAIIMRIDFATLAFGYSIKVGGGTPNWATSLGQGKEYKINEDPDIDELLKGMVYSSVSLSKVTSKIGKGGRVISANAEDSPIIIASVFNKVYVNDKLISGGNFVMLITRDTSKSHAGRLRFKYGPSNSYRDDDNCYSNEHFWAKAKEQLGLAEDACLFVYDISVENQNELVLSTIIVNPHGKKEYIDSTDHHAHWDELIEEDEKKKGKKPKKIQSEVTGVVEDTSISNEITPLWFEEKAVNFPLLDSDAAKFLMKFKMVFGIEKLQALSGTDLLNTIFLNNNNKTNLCYILEFDQECRMIFGSIKSGTAYKYGLHYSQKNKTWATGTGRNPQFLKDEEAIELGTQIRDYLVVGAAVIENAGKLETLDDYQNLYDDLYDVTDGYINRVWFMKYYALLYPELFPPIYSTNAQNTVLNKLGIKSGNNLVYRIGQIKKYVDKCNISNVVFSRIFWTFCNGDENKENDQEECETLKTCLDVVKNPRTNKIHSMNSIIYGAPGTGKTYSMVDYALSIIDDVTYVEFIANNTDRKANINRYKEYVKAGQIVFTTFHQNYGYEEFIQGLRPDKDSETMSFKTVDGVFKTIADNALNDKDGKNFVIIIDEINRANISKVFGELITLIEEDKRWGELNETSVTLQSGDPFAVPNNLYIVGTMNSADKSISLIDAALRRRFSFIEQLPDATLVTDPTMKSVLENLNIKLVDELESTDLLIGHSYFMNKSKEDLSVVLNNNIIPLLYEYFYDNKKKVAAVLKDAIMKSGASIDIVDEKVGRLKVKIKGDEDGSE